jgi:hypothetical protein
MQLPRNWNLIAGAIVIGFLFVAMTLGMSEWKDTTPTTAKAPAATTVR